MTLTAPDATGLNSSGCIVGAPSMPPAQEAGLRCVLLAADPAAVLVVGAVWELPAGANGSEGGG